MSCAEQSTILVSVVMPAYNAEKYIRQAVSSVLNQTHENLEMIVVDDCSTDHTYEILEDLASGDARIRLFRNEHNSGVAKTRNKGFELCRGEYVALLDSDDLWRQDKIEKQLALARSGNADIVYCSYAMIDDTGAHSFHDFIVPEETNFNDMLVRSCLSCSTAMIKGTTLAKYRFDDQFYHEDYVLWMQMMRDGCRALGLPEILADYRINRNSRSFNKFKAAVNRWRIYRMEMRLPFFKSLYVWMGYMLNGLKKYR